MHELINTRTGKIIILPSDIEELTPEQYLFYLELVIKYFSGEISGVLEVKRRLFVKLANVKASLKTYFYPPEVREAIWDAITEKIHLMDSFFDVEETDDGKKYKMHTNSVQNLLPQWKGYAAYTDIFAQMTWGEFSKCVKLLKMIQQQTEKKNDDAADGLVKELFFTLYKPAKKLKKTQRIPETVLFHAYNYFSYILELITTVPIEINGEEIDFFVLWKREEEEDQDKQKTDLDKIGWDNILLSVSKEGVFGNAEQVNNEKFIMVLLFLYKQRAEAIITELNLNKNK